MFLLKVLPQIEDAPSHVNRANKGYQIEEQHPRLEGKQKRA